MKIRDGFVTNSSSTSYLISLKHKWDKKEFLRVVGAEGTSPMNKVFEDLFESIDEQKQEIHSVIREIKSEGLTVSIFLKERGYDHETIEVVEKLIAEGRTVYFGEMRSDASNCSETYFCLQSFIICENDIYFNGRIGGW